uniref:C2H2-type domain-containing protein n=1 Tax=Timema poppense TaxID=170557 RepID=A0A7R9D7R9_TIMPO|nr:unnamed protein product [Timema poppensis]
MASKQKRSDGGYGLRRKIAKKRLDEDFEYYFSKIGTNLESTGPKMSKERDPKMHGHLILVAGMTDSNTMIDQSNAEVTEKKPRGRPRKTLLIPRRPSRKRESQEDGVVLKRLAVLTGEDVTTLQREVRSGEKENKVRQTYESEVGVVVRMALEGQVDEIEDDEEDICQDEGEQAEKFISKSNKRLNEEAVQSLSQLHPDDKIECTECHKLLKPSSFRQHLRTHTGEKPFGCQLCLARFTRKGDVYRHVRIVHNKQKPYKCSKCDRAFGDRKNLRWHLMNHDKKLFYICEVCDFKFGKREYWENHVKFIHPLPEAVELGENEMMFEDGEERLKVFTDTLLEDDETSMVDDSLVDIADNMSLPVREGYQREGKTEILEGSNMVGFIKQDGLNIINMNGLDCSNFLKIGRPLGVQLGNVLNQSQSKGIDAVVIEFDGSGSVSSSVQHIPLSRNGPSSEDNCINPVNMMEIIHEELKEEPITVNQESDRENVRVEQQHVLEVTIGDGRDTSLEEPSNMISIMMAGGDGTDLDTSSGNVHTLIEALLDAARDDDVGEVQSS